MASILRRNDRWFVRVRKQPGLSLAKIRADETRLALKEIGLPIFLNLPDGGLSKSISAQKKIEEEVNNIQPDIIVTHAPEDYHPDHSTLSLLVQNSSGFNYPVIYSDTFVGHNFNPNIYIDITRFFDAKKEKYILKT